MNAFSALVYLEVQQLRHLGAGIFKKPARAIFWGLWLALIIGPQFLAGNTYRPGLTHAPEPLASMIALIAVALFGFSVISQVSSSFVAFTSQADARFLVSSHISPRVIGMWLQFRRIAYELARGIFFIIVYIFIWNRHHRSGGVVLTAVAYFALTSTVAIPALSFCRRFTARPVSVLCSALIVVSLGAAAILALPYSGHATLLSAHAAHGLIHLGLGNALNRMLAGDAVYLTVAYALVAVMCALAYFCTADLFPELYEVSMAALQRLHSMRRGLFSRTQQPRQGGTQIAAPQSEMPPAYFSGARMIFWKEWLSFKRGTDWRFTLIMWGFIWALCGSAPLLVSKGSDASLIYTIDINVVNLLLLFVAISSVSLADDLRKPLWWLSSGNLTQRLWAWLGAGAWRLAAGLALGIASAGVAGHRLWLLVLAIPAACFLALYVKTIGLATYSLFPSKMDARGPIMGLRVFLTYFALLPPAIGAVIGIPFHSLVVGITASLVLLGSEMFALVAFATWRISGAGVSFAQEEAS